MLLQKERRWSERVARAHIHSSTEPRTAFGQITMNGSAFMNAVSATMRATHSTTHKLNWTSMASRGAWSAFKLARDANAIT